jgi:tetratricopeptide (TPR) repeat protein/DNA-binding XRE family transcriptional regulator
VTVAFGDELRRLRVERGYSLADLSRLVYYSRGHLSKIENGRHTPQLEHAWQLDVALDANGALVSELPGYGRDPAGRRDESWPSPPSGLPPQPPVFAGREAEARVLKTQLCAVTDASQEVPVVCVVNGLAGVGKTALAASVASQIAPRFPDGVVFLDLHGYTGNTPPLTPADALGRLLRRFGLPVPEELDERAARWRDHVADRRVLVVADNVRDAEQVRPLVPLTSASRMLVTSRSLLVPLDGAFELSLGPLAQEEGEFLLSQLAAGPVSRSPVSAESVPDIVRACGRLPLALIIAGARLRAGTTPADLCEALAGEAPLAEITDGERSLAAAFTASHRALPPDVQGTFARLGLLPGATWTTDYVMALDDADRPTALRRVERLVAARLTDPDADGRFRCHDLVRSYARQLSGELPVDAAKHAMGELVAWAMDMTARADALIEPHRYRPIVRVSRHARPFAGQVAAAAWLQAEQENLVTLCQAAYDQGLDEQCWLLAYFLRSHFFLTKQYDAWVATHTAALSAASRAGAVGAQAMTRNNLGVALADLGHFAAADAQFTAVLALPPCEDGLEHAQANARAHRSWLLHTQGEWVQSVAEGEAAWRFFSEHGMDRNAAIIRRGMALAEVELGLVERGIAHLEESLATFDRLGLDLNAVMARNCLGEASLRKGDMAKAEEWLTAAVSAARACGSLYEEARALRRLGDVALASGDKETAISRWAGALDRYALMQASEGPEAAELSARLALTQ